MVRRKGSIFLINLSKPYTFYLIGSKCAVFFLLLPLDILRKRWKEIEKQNKKGGWVGGCGWVGCVGGCGCGCGGCGCGWVRDRRVGPGPGSG
jgi:hypothetical protein